VLFFTENLWHDITKLAWTYQFSTHFFEKSSHAKRPQLKMVSFPKIQFLKERICQAFVGNLRKQKNILKYPEILLTQASGIDVFCQWCLCMLLRNTNLNPLGSELSIFVFGDPLDHLAVSSVFWWPSQPSILMEKSPGMPETVRLLRLTSAGICPSTMHKRAHNPNNQSILGKCLKLTLEISC